MTVGLVITAILFLTKLGPLVNDLGFTYSEAALQIVAVLPGIWLPMFIEFGVYILIFLGWIALAIGIWRS